MKLSQNAIIIPSCNGQDDLTNLPLSMQEQDQMAPLGHLAMCQDG
jgi:hypothetical protein